MKIGGIRIEEFNVQHFIVPLPALPQKGSAERLSRFAGGGGVIRAKEGEINADRLRDLLNPRLP